MNRPYMQYNDKELLNEDGDKPCFECYLEAEAAKEEESQEE
jgi:hypothetical protein